MCVLLLKCCCFWRVSPPVNNATLPSKADRSPDELPDPYSSDEIRTITHPDGKESRIILPGNTLVGFTAGKVKRASNMVLGPSTPLSPSSASASKGVSVYSFPITPPSTSSLGDVAIIRPYENIPTISIDVKARPTEMAGSENVEPSAPTSTQTNSKAKLPIAARLPRTRTRGGSLSAQNSLVDKLPELPLIGGYISNHPLQTSIEEAASLHRTRSTDQFNGKGSFRKRSHSLSRGPQSRIPRSMSSGSLSCESSRTRRDLVGFLRPLAEGRRAEQEDIFFSGGSGDGPRSFTKLLLSEAICSKIFPDGFFGPKCDCDQLVDLMLNDIDLLRRFFSLKASIDMSKDLLTWWSPDFLEGSFFSSVKFSSRLFEAISSLKQQKPISARGRAWAWMDLIVLPSECLSRIQCLDFSREGQNIEELPYKKLFQKFPSLEVLILNNNAIDIPLPEDLAEADNLHFLSLVGVPVQLNGKIGENWHSMWSLYERAEKHWPENTTIPLQDQKEKILSLKNDLQRIYVNTTWLDKYRKGEQFLEDLQSVDGLSSMQSELSSLLLCFIKFKQFVISW